MHNIPKLVQVINGLKYESGWSRQGDDLGEANRITVRKAR
jgi:hypothetical protein